MEPIPTTPTGDAAAAPARRKFPWLALSLPALLVIIVASLIGYRASFQSRPPDFQVVVQQGEVRIGAGEVSFGSVLERGQPVVLNFWAGLCPPCRAEMPAFQRLHDELGDEFILVGVDVGPFTGLGTQEDAERLLRELDITYPSAYSLSMEPLTGYGVHAMPTTIYFSAAGELLHVHAGFLSEDQMRRDLSSYFGITSGAGG